MKTLSVKVDENTYAEIKFCAKNLKTTPAVILQVFVEDLLEDTKEPNAAQKWFWKNKHKFQR